MERLFLHSAKMSLRNVITSINKIWSRPLFLSRSVRGDDKREKRQGLIPKKDSLEGEFGPLVVSNDSYELIDEDLMDRVFGNTRFKDIPILTIRCTRNNTKIRIHKGDGETQLVSKSAGTEGYKNCRKGTTVAAQAVANRVVTYAQDHEIDMVRLVFNGLGPGRSAAYKVIELSGLKVVSLSDRTEAIEPWVRRPRKAKRL